MPWKETHVMEERLKFIMHYLEGGLEHDGALPDLRDQPQDGLQVAGALCGGRCFGIVGPEPGAASPSASDGG